MEHEEVPRALNPSAVTEYLIFRFVAGEDTMFDGIKCLLPGQMMIVEGDRYRFNSFWDPYRYESRPTTDEPRMVDHLDGLLEDSVRLRLMADVPLGAFCSGGVDSSLTTAYAVNLGRHRLNTFSVGFKESEFDESRYARIVSDQYETVHHQMVIDNKTFADSLPRIIWFNDEPLNHANSVPIHLISLLAREHVTVVLTGEGSDELFGGYSRYMIARIYSQLRSVPRFGRRLIKGAMSLMGTRRLKKLGQFLTMSPQDAAMFNAFFIGQQAVNALTLGRGASDALKYRRALTQDISLADDELVSRTMALDLRTYLLSLLSRMDKMTMAASLEARVPFLDHRLVEWSSCVPLDLKLRRTETKYLVKRLGERLLPREVVYRAKSGFGVPVSDWVFDREGLGRYLEMFDEQRFQARGYLDVSVVKRIIKEHLERKADHGELLWELINLEIWHRTFLDREVSVFGDGYPGHPG